MSETNSDLNPSEISYDAQQAAEEITAGDRPAPEVNVSDDYEASKQFSVSEIDRTGAGEKAAESATAPDFNLSQPKEAESKAAESTGDPSDYLDMAKDVAHPGGSAGNVSDDLVKKAIERGQPGQ